MGEEQVFTGKAWTAGTNVCVITVPANIRRLLNLNPGDNVRCVITKIENKDAWKEINTVPIEYHIDKSRKDKKTTEE